MGPWENAGNDEKMLTVGLMGLRVLRDDLDQNRSENERK